MSTGVIYKHLELFVKELKIYSTELKIHTNAFKLHVLDHKVELFATFFHADVGYARNLLHCRALDNPGRFITNWELPRSVSNTWDDGGSYC